MSAAAKPSLKALAEAAQRKPWDKSEYDPPFASRHAFKQAITADHYLEILAALEGVVRVADRATDEFDAARAAIAAATGSQQ
jgi:hypothetical protein